jgi:hypothetical protein
MKILVEVKRVNERYYHLWDEDENCCVHGIKSRWVCDECSDLRIAEAQPETAGRTLAGVAPTTTQGIKVCPFYELSFDFDDESAQEFGVSVCKCEGKPSPVA